MMNRAGSVLWGLVRTSYVRTAPGASRVRVVASVAVLAVVIALFLSFGSVGYR
jgi:hypothetical protein